MEVLVRYLKVNWANSGEIAEKQKCEAYTFIKAFVRLVKCEILEQ